MFAALSLKHARLVLGLLSLAALAPCTHAQVPVFTIVTSDSSVKFYVKASVKLVGTFEKWNSTLTFSSPDVNTGVLNINVQADSVNTGSGMKNGKLKSKDFFDVKQNPTISFVSKKIVQTGPNTFEVDGDFTIRGVTKPETLTLTVNRSGAGSGEIKGTMAFDRRDYGMTKGIPFVTIADRIEVTVDLTGKRVGGPALVFKQ